MGAGAPECAGDGRLAWMEQGCVSEGHATLSIPDDDVMRMRRCPLSIISPPGRNSPPLPHIFSHLTATASYILHVHKHSDGHDFGAAAHMCGQGKTGNVDFGSLAVLCREICGAQMMRSVEKGLYLQSWKQNVSLLGRSSSSSPGCHGSVFSTT